MAGIERQTDEESTNRGEARELGFAGSPTILLDGADPFPRAEMVTGLACRVYDQPGGQRGVPELAALVAAIRRHEAARAHGVQTVDRQVTSGPGGAAALAGTDVAAGR